MTHRPLALAAIAMSALALSAHADEIDVGKQLYTEFCATCHGTEGQGNGDMTEVLTVPVPDLTTLTKRNDGTFPMLKVIHIIDGRTGLRAHGGPMPLFGRMFADREQNRGYGSVVETRGRVLSLAMYLESIQR